MRYTWAAVPAALLVAAGIYWVRQRDATTAAPAISALQTAAVKRGTVRATMTATGTVQAWNETVVRVGVGVSGTLQPFQWTVSQTVHQDQTLFALVNPDQQQQTATDEANLREAELQLQQMQASAADTQVAQADEAKARLAVNQAQWAYGQAQTALAAAGHVVAPAAGVIASVDASPGAGVGSGTTIASIVQTAQLLCTVDASTAQLASIVAGAQATVFADGGQQGGRVVSVAPTPDVLDKGIPFYPVTISLANPGTWLPGMPAQATVATGSAADPTWITDLAGQLAAPPPVNAVAAAAGTVGSVAVAVGQSVTAGQVLATLQTPDLGDAATVAEQSLQQAEASLAATMAQNRQSAITQPYALQQQEIKVQQLQEAVARDRTLDAGLTVRSPVTGVISGVQAVAGQPVGAGTPLMTIGDYSRLLVSFPLDQLYVDRVKVGEPAAVTATAAPGKTFSGSLYLVAPEGTDVNGQATFQAEVLIPKPEAALRPGMAADVTIDLGTARGVLEVPLQALHLGSNGREFVVVVGPGATTTTTPVAVGLSDSLDAQVSASGLRAGDRVLTSSLNALKSAQGLNLRGRTISARRTVTHRAPPTKG